MNAQNDEQEHSNNLQDPWQTQTNVKSHKHWLWDEKMFTSDVVACNGNCR